MLVKDLMTPGAVTVEPGSSVALAAKLISRHNVGLLPVCSPDKRLRGVVTDRDIVLRCVALNRDPAATKTGDIMSRGVLTASPAEDAAAAGRVMAQGQVRRLPVVEGGKVVGFLSLGDLAVRAGTDMEAGKALGKISANLRSL